MDLLVLFFQQQGIITGKQAKTESSRSLNGGKTGRGDSCIQVGLAFGKRCEQGRAACGKHKPLAVCKQGGKVGEGTIFCTLGKQQAQLLIPLLILHEGMDFAISFSQGCCTDELDIAPLGFLPAGRVPAEAVSVGYGDLFHIPLLEPVEQKPWLHGPPQEGVTGCNGKPSFHGKGPLHG